jgi:hypothetical protein
MGGPLVNLETALQKDRMISDWAKYTVQRLQESIYDRESAAATRELMRSIKMELIKAGGDIERVILKFLQYGRFYDMGVGRGVPIGAAGSGAFSAARNNDGTLKQYRRKPVKWFSPVYYREVQKFNQLYVELFREGIPVQIAEALTQNVTLAA